MDFGKCPCCTEGPKGVSRCFRRSGAEIPHPSPSRPISARYVAEGAGIGLLGLRRITVRGVGRQEERFFDCASRRRSKNTISEQIKTSGRSAQNDVSCGAGRQEEGFFDCVPTRGSRKADLRGRLERQDAPLRMTLRNGADFENEESVKMAGARNGCTSGRANTGSGENFLAHG